MSCSCAFISSKCVFSPGIISSNNVAKGVLLGASTANSASDIGGIELSLQLSGCISVAFVASTCVVSSLPPAFTNFASVDVS